MGIINWTIQCRVNYGGNLRHSLWNHSDCDSNLDTHWDNELLSMTDLIALE